MSNGLAAPACLGDPNTLLATLDRKVLICAIVAVCWGCGSGTTVPPTNRFCPPTQDLPKCTHDAGSGTWVETAVQRGRPGKIRVRGYLIHYVEACTPMNCVSETGDGVLHCNACNGAVVLAASPTATVPSIELLAGGAGGNVLSTTQFFKCDLRGPACCPTPAGGQHVLAEGRLVWPRSPTLSSIYPGLRDPILCELPPG